MSRRTKSQEEWDRRQNYLIRSLFEDVPQPSPTYENRETDSPSPSDNRYRCESPLPDLIIEKEQVKPNLCDETEEFYDKLEKEMKHLYERDYLNVVESSDSSEEATEYTQNRTGQSQDKGYTNRRNLTSSQDSICVENLCYKEAAMDHAADPEASTNRENSSRTQGSIRVENQCREQVAEVEHAACLANNKEASAESPTSHNKSPEVMRRRQTSRRQDSISYHELPLRDSADRSLKRSLAMDTDDKNTSEEILTTGREMEFAGFSNYLHVEATSTPKSSGKKRSRSRRIYKRRLLSSSFNGNVDCNAATQTSFANGNVGNVDCNAATQTSFANGNVGNINYHAATQTSFSDDEPDWRNLWNNLIIGTPTVYKLCSCSNHVCS